MVAITAGTGRTSPIFPTLSSHAACMSLGVQDNSKPVALPDQQVALKACTDVCCSHGKTILAFVTDATGSTATVLKEYAAGREMAYSFIEYAKSSVYRRVEIWKVGHADFQLKTPECASMVCSYRAPRCPPCHNKRENIRHYISCAQIPWNRSSSPTNPPSPARMFNTLRQSPRPQVQK